MSFAEISLYSSRVRCKALMYTRLGVKPSVAFLDKPTCPLRTAPPSTDPLPQVPKTKHKFSSHSLLPLSFSPALGHCNVGESKLDVCQISCSDFSQTSAVPLS